MHKEVMESTCIEELHELHAREVSGYELQYFQLDRGAFRARYEGYQFAQPAPESTVPPAQIHEVSLETYGRSVELCGQSNPAACGFVFGMSGPSLTANGLELHPGTILVVRPGQEISYVVPSGLQTIDIHCAPELARNLFSAADRSVDGLQIIHPAAETFRAFTRNVAQRLREEENGAPARSLIGETNAWIVESLLGLLQSPEFEASTETRAHRLRICSQARDLLHASLDRPMTTTELCDLTNSRVRTLQLAFRGQFGISPIAYHHRIRMNHARQRLHAAEKGEVTVTEVALKYGFGHLGRFSVDYRKLFSESPSATLARGQRARAARAA